MFTDADFEVFKDDTLAGRMTKIKTIIDPKFLSLATRLEPIFKLQQVMLYPHVAKHMRRTVNPPVDTWIAFGPQKRGYKKDPHLEIGLWPHALFVWLVVLQEGKQNDETLISRVVRSQSEIQRRPQLQLSNDHTTADHVVNDTEHLAVSLTQFEQHPKSEFLVGRIWSQAELMALDANQQLAAIEATVDAVMPIYRHWL